MSQRESIVVVATEEDRAMAAGDVERFLSLLAQDCVMMPPNAKPLSGGAIRPWIAAFFDSVTVTPQSYTHGAVEICGDWAWHEYACQWSVTRKTDGTVVTPRFKGLHVMRREDGWKIVRNIWNLDP